MKKEWILKILVDILVKASPEIKKIIADFVNHLEEKADKTENDWDNLAVHLLKMLLSM